MSPTNLIFKGIFLFFSLSFFFLFVVNLSTLFCFVCSLSPVRSGPVRSRRNGWIYLTNWILWIIPISCSVEKEKKISSFSCCFSPTLFNLEYNTGRLLSATNERTDEWTTRSNTDRMRLALQAGCSISNCQDASSSFLIKHKAATASGQLVVKWSIQTKKHISRPPPLLLVLAAAVS